MKELSLLSIDVGFDPRAAHLSIRVPSSGRVRVLYELREGGQATAEGEVSDVVAEVTAKGGYQFAVPR